MDTYIGKDRGDILGQMAASLPDWRTLILETFDTLVLDTCGTNIPEMYNNRNFDTHPILQEISDKVAENGFNFRMYKCDAEMKRSWLVS